MTTNLTAHLDDLATELQFGGHVDLALALDRVSDHLEGRIAFLSFGKPKEEFPVEELKEEFDFVEIVGGIYDQKKYEQVSPDYTSFKKVADKITALISKNPSREVTFKAVFRNISKEKDWEKKVPEIISTYIGESRIKKWSPGFKEGKSLKEGSVVFNVKSPKEIVAIVDTLQDQFQKGGVGPDMVGTLEVSLKGVYIENVKSNVLLKMSVHIATKAPSKTPESGTETLVTPEGETKTETPVVPGTPETKTPAAPEYGRRNVRPEKLKGPIPAKVPKKKPSKLVGETEKAFQEREKQKKKLRTQVKILPPTKKKKIEFGRRRARDIVARFLQESDV